MSAAQFRLEQLRQRLGARDDAGEAVVAEPDPLALDPLSPIASEPGSAELADQLAFDPLSPIGRDAR